jgi:hypothetical protein
MVVAGATTMSSKGLASAVALMCLSYGVGCGLAARQPGAATRGAIEEARQEQPRARRQDEVAFPARLTGEEAKQGIIDALAESETRAQPPRSVNATVSQSPRSVPDGRSPSAAEGPVATASAGAAGEGPGVGGADLAGELTRPVVEESRSEPGAVFPQCDGLRGEAARTCMEARLSDFGAAVAQAAAGEVREALQPWLFLLTFGGGLLVAQEGGHSRWQARRRERLLSHLLREGNGHAPAGLLTSLRARIFGEGRWRGEEG